MTSVPLFDLIIDQFLNPEATMTKQGDLSLLDDPVAQTLLHSTSLARLAYVWRDDTPRVVPIWFHWTGNEIVKRNCNGNTFQSTQAQGTAQ